MRNEEWKEKLCGLTGLLPEQYLLVLLVFEDGQTGKDGPLQRPPLPTTYRGWAHIHAAGRLKKLSKVP